ncbi:hypothetical protein AOX59_02565 [Lentibacillus amyloliquefaciens]|uniref:Uncharacterized protein n=1 Tax=Lentibacillus amyloliquefaciens TaxID=1472767 RepID=A0A0U3WCP5_9BACI|nr:hypothetical protein AOX59_02565 [Lentibacillus amyloliquefaciens]
MLWESFRKDKEFTDSLFHGISNVDAFGIFDTRSSRWNTINKEDAMQAIKAARAAFDKGP